MPSNLLAFFTTATHCLSHFKSSVTIPEVFFLLHVLYLNCILLWIAGYWYLLAHIELQWWLVWCAPLWGHLLSIGLHELLLSLWILCVYYCDRMQRLTTMVCCSLRHTTTGYGFPVHPSSQCLPVTCVHRALIKQRILDTSSPSSRISFASLSYIGHLLREIHVSCRHKSNGTRRDVPNEHIVNICHLIALSLHFTHFLYSLLIRP